MSGTGKARPVFGVAEEEGLFAVQRNGRYLMTPAGAAYLLPTRVLAEAIVVEWNAQGDKIVPASMPMTQIAATSFDIVGKDREKTVSGLLAYTDSELVCHRTQGPSPLAEKQEKIWQPFLNWCCERYGVSFAVGCGVMPVRQKPEIADALGRAIRAMGDFHLAGLSCSTDSAGSLVLGLALAEKAFTAAQVFEASELDATHQAIAWGEDPAAKARQESVRRDLEACERWFRLLG